MSEELAAKQQIYEALLRYSRGVDRGDAALIKSAYHEESRDEHMGFTGTGHDFADFIVDVLKKWNACLHRISNVYIEVDGETARSEAYCMSIHDTGDQVVTTHTRYLDRFEKRGGEWKIAHRLVIYDLRQVAPPASPFDPADTRPIYGRRDKTDPSHTLFAP